MTGYKRKKFLTQLGLISSSIVFAWAVTLVVHSEISVGEEWWDSCQALEDPQHIMDCKNEYSIYPWETKDQYVKRSRNGSAQKNFELIIGILSLLLFVIFDIFVYEFLTRKNFFSKH